MFDQLANKDVIRDVPPYTEELLQWFSELNSRRTIGFERNPLTWSDMQAWAMVTGRRPTPWQWQVLWSLDDVVMGRWEDREVKKQSLVSQIAALKKDG